MDNEQISRRTFLGLAAAGAMTPWTAWGQSSASRYVDHMGVQLYTVRQQLAENPAATLAALREIGFAHVEAFDFGSLGRLASLAKDADLEITSTHFNPSYVIGDWRERGMDVPADGGDVAAVIAGARENGLELVVFPYLAAEQRGDLDAYRRLAAKLNAAGEKCRAAGLQLCYHNHQFEFIQMGEKTPFDIFVEETDKDFLQFEIDVFWATFAGFDAVKFLRRHGDRCRLLHLKDLKDGVERSPSANPAAEAFEELGDGIVDFPAVLAVAAELGAVHGYVEQDHCAGDPLVSLRQSAGYLRSLTL